MNKTEFFIFIISQLDFLIKFTSIFDDKAFAQRLP